MSKWDMVRLGDVATFNMGQSPPSESYNNIGEGLPFFQGKSDFGLMYPTVRMFCNTPRKIAKKNDILLSVRAPVGTVNIATETCCIGRGLAAISQKNNISNYKYIYYYLFYKENEISSMGVGSTFKAISKKDLDAIELPLPPLLVQQKIADVLDRANALIEKRKAQIGKLDLLVKSQFVEMFGDPVTNPKGWKFNNINNICHTIVDCPHSTPNFIKANTGFMCMRTSILKPNQINWEQIEYISGEQYIKRTKRYIPQKHDIVYSREGAILGIAAIIDKDYKVAMGQRMMLLSADLEICNSKYLCFMLNSPYIVNQVKNRISGSASPHINVADVKNFNVPIPSLDLQIQFSDFIECIEAQKTLFNENLALMELNYKSLMQKCFTNDTINTISEV